MNKIIKKNNKRVKIIENKDKINFKKELFLPFLVSFVSVLLIINSASFISKSAHKVIVKNEVKKALIESSAPREKIKELIELEKSLYIDPLTLLKIIDSQDKGVIIIDIRDKDSYKRAHIKNAVNYSLESMKKSTSDFKKKKIIIYSDTMSSITSKQAALFLIEKSIDARILSIGWNEFRHFRNLWIPESQWDKIDLNNYLSN